VLTTSPPSSVHFVGAAVKRATGARWVADLRDSLVAHPHRRAERMLVRIKEQGEHGIAALAETAPDELKQAPRTTPVGRLDEAAAARRPDLKHDFAAVSTPPSVQQEVGARPQTAGKG